jgi:hypothetical protein
LLSRRARSSGSHRLKRVFFESEGGRPAGIEDFYFALRFVNFYHFQHSLFFSFGQVVIGPCLVFFLGRR